MSYREEFPNYPPADLPPIPETWRDSSWRNDSCPSWEAGCVRVFVDYLEPAQREFPDVKRFSVQGSDHTDTLFESDDWGEVLAFVERANANA